MTGQERGGAGAGQWRAENVVLNGGTEGAVSRAHEAQSRRARLPSGGEGGCLSRVPVLLVPRTAAPFVGPSGGCPSGGGAVQGLAVGGQAHDRQAVVHVHHLASDCRGGRGGGLGGGQQARRGGQRRSTCPWLALRQTASQRSMRQSMAKPKGKRSRQWPQLPRPAGCRWRARARMRGAVGGGQPGGRGGGSPAEASGEHRKVATAPTSVAASSFCMGAFSYE